MQQLGPRAMLRSGGHVERGGSTRSVMGLRARAKGKVVRG